MDRRQQKTRDAIFISFGKLLAEKNYSKITVQEIIEAANVGRSTFYAHFETKDELLREMCSDIFQHVFSDHPGTESTHDFSLSKGSPETVITHILYHLRDNKKNITGILGCESGELFLQFFRQYLSETVVDCLMEKVAFKSGGPPDDFLMNHVTGSFVNMVQWWIKNQLKQSPEELTSYFMAVIRPLL
ncbi:MAG: TetR/AcrR family transcriptional regulator [Lachnospiraceae bacterium]